MHTSRHPIHVTDEHTPSSITGGGGGGGGCADGVAGPPAKLPLPEEKASWPWRQRSHCGSTNSGPLQNRTVQSGQRQLVLFFVFVQPWCFRQRTCAASSLRSSGQALPSVGSMGPEQWLQMTLPVSRSMGKGRPQNKPQMPESGHQQLPGVLRRHAPHRGSFHGNSKGETSTHSSTMHLTLPWCCCCCFVQAELETLPGRHDSGHWETGPRT